MVVWIACLCGPCPAQRAPENPQTPREFSRAVAHTVQRYDAVCRHAVRWVIAFDISRSGMGQWIEWSRQIVYDLAKYVFVEGDTVVLIPFDVAVNPKGGGLPTFDVTEAGKSELQNAIGSLLQCRLDSPDGTAWVEATRTALREAANVGQTAPSQVALVLVISDRDSSDALPDERSQIDGVAGVAKPGQDLWPLPRDVKPVVVLHSISDYRPSAPGPTATRWVPPWEPTAGTPPPQPAPLPAPQRKLPLAAWVTAAVLAVVGLWLLASGLSSRRSVKLRWGDRESDPGRRTSLDLPVGEQRGLQASAEPSPDPLVIFADGATNDVQRKTILPTLGRLEATTDGIAVVVAEQYLLRADPAVGWTNRVDLRRGDPPAWIEFRLATATWPLTREPIGLEVGPEGRDARTRIAVGAAALCLAALIALVARPTTPRAAPPPPRPAASGQPTEGFCR